MGVQRADGRQISYIELATVGSFHEGGAESLRREAGRRANCIVRVHRAINKFSYKPRCTQTETFHSFHDGAQSPTLSANFITGLLRA